MMSIYFTGAASKNKSCLQMKKENQMKVPLCKDDV